MRVYMRERERYREMRERERERVKRIEKKKEKRREKKERKREKKKHVTQIDRVIFFPHILYLQKQNNTIIRLKGIPKEHNKAFKNE